MHVRVLDDCPSIWSDALEMHMLPLPRVEQVRVSHPELLRARGSHPFKSFAKRLMAVEELQDYQSRLGRKS